MQRGKHPPSYPCIVRMGRSQNDPTDALIGCTGMWEGFGTTGAQRNWPGTFCSVRTVCGLPTNPRPPYRSL